MRKIALNGKHGKGKFALVDDKYYKYLMQWEWSLSKTGSKYYVTRGQTIEGVYRTYYMHREVMKAKKGNVVDHRDGDTLNNLESNLRECKHKNNNRNQVKRKGCSSQYKGVYKYYKQWQAQLYSEGKNHYLGLYVSEKEAGLAYDRKAKELYREYAKLNFPKEESIPK